MNPRLLVPVALLCTTALISSGCAVEVGGGETADRDTVDHEKIEKTLESMAEARTGKGVDVSCDDDIKQKSGERGMCTVDVDGTEYKVETTVGLIEGEDVTMLYDMDDIEAMPGSTGEPAPAPTEEPTPQTEPSDDPNMVVGQAKITPNALAPGGGTYRAVFSIDLAEAVAASLRQRAVEGDLSRNFVQGLFVICKDMYTPAEAGEANMCTISGDGTDTFEVPVTFVNGEGTFTYSIKQII